MLEQFSNRSGRGQIQKSAAGMRHDQALPKRRDVSQPEHADCAAKERSCFYSRHPTERGRATKSRADQKTAEREAFRHFVNAESGEERPFCRVYRRRFLLNPQYHTIGGAVNRQGNNQRSGDLAKMPCCICVEMTGSARRANMVDMFADEEEQQVSGGRSSDNWPSAAITQTFR